MFVKAREGELAHWLIKHCDIFLRFDRLLSLIIIAMQFLIIIAIQLSDNAQMVL